MWQKIKCWLGWHEWEDITHPSLLKEGVHYYRCKHCHKFKHCW